MCNLRSSRRGLSPGLPGIRNEHLKVLLSNSNASHDLYVLGQHVARAQIPDEAAAAMRMCLLIPIRKNNGKLRSLNAGDSFRRLVAKTLAQQFAQDFRAATSPYNFGMSAHSGIRTRLDSDPNLCLTKIDGIGAFDHILRSTMLSNLYTLPRAKNLLPFVRMSYQQSIEFIWSDDQGVAHVIAQGEGGEQGNPLVLGLFCLGLHDALHSIGVNLQPNERLIAYLNDIYILSSVDRARNLYDNVAQAIYDSAGI